MRNGKSYEKIGTRTKAGKGIRRRRKTAKLKGKKK